MIPLDVLERLIRTQNDTRISDNVRRVIERRVLVMLVGPAAVGKSTIMNTALTLDPDFARVSGFTTRDARPDDESGIYRYLTTDKDIAAVIARIDAGEVVQYAVHPTTHKIYGSEPRDYPGRFSMLDTLSGVVEGLRALPFARTVTVGLVAEADDWKSWFKARYPEPTDDAVKRLAEAAGSVRWIISHDTDTGSAWLVNRPGGARTTASNLIGIVRDGDAPDADARVTAIALLARIAALQEEYASGGTRP